MKSFFKTRLTVGIFVMFHAVLQAQNNVLASEYFAKGEFEKAESLYKTLYDENTSNYFYFDRLIQCQNALQKYDEAKELLLKKSDELSKQPFNTNYALVNLDLGYNYQLHDEPEKAQKYYQIAFDYLKAHPDRSYMIARKFQDYQKMDYALQGYEFMMQSIPTANYYNQIATIYGEMGEIEKMFNTFLDWLIKQYDDIETIKRFVERYLTDDNQGENNILLRKILTKRIQDNPQIEWYKLLSWLYLQQKEYSKALVQEKAIFNHFQTDFNGIIEVGKIAFEAGDFYATQDAFEYISLQNPDVDTQILAHFYLLQSIKNTEKDTEKIHNAYQSFFNQYGTEANTAQIQTSYAQYLTFFENKPDEAIKVLQEVLQNNLDRFMKSEIKIQMADIMVFMGRYNQALVTYTQVQNDLKNHPLAQTARFKVAQTSYFQGDFRWANAQLKVLKKGTSKLIANDAIDLSLLIGDNIAEDSIQTALKSYAQADLLAYQNKSLQAIDTLTEVLRKFKGHPIEDEALFRQAQLFEKLEKYADAEKNYLSIIQLYGEDILADDAMYHVALLYDEKLFNTGKAQTYYEKIILEQPSSIYLVPARKRFRELRGDVLVP